MLPRIYTLDCPAPGHIVDSQPLAQICSSCGLPSASYDWVNYELETWNGCELLSSAPVLFVTDALHNRLLAASVRGFKSQATDTSYSQQYFLGGARATQVPRLWLMMITGQADGPWTRQRRATRCAQCGRWSAEPLTPQEFQEMSEEIREKSPARPTLVDARTWQGEDIFRVTEPGRPLVTEKFAEILRETGNLGATCCSLGPAEWVCDIQTNAAARTLADCARLENIPNP